MIYNCSYLTFLKYCNNYIINSIYFSSVKLRVYLCFCEIFYLFWYLLLSYTSACFYLSWFWLWVSFVQVCVLAMDFVEIECWWHYLWLWPSWFYFPTVFTPWAYWILSHKIAIVLSDTVIVIYVWSLGFLRIHSCLFTG